VFLRFLRFNVVSALGIFVQLAAVTVLVGALGVHYLVGTAVAIELAVLHNFAWHERWTWRERTGERKHGGAGLQACSRDSPFFRCLAFHAGNGCVSLVGSLALMPVFVAVLHLHYLLANLATIALTGLLNFLISDRLVFGAPNSSSVQRRASNAHP
jgi:putative flippase GtrA